MFRERVAAAANGRLEDQIGCAPCFWPSHRNSERQRAICWVKECRQLLQRGSAGPEATSKVHASVSRKPDHDVVRFSLLLARGHRAFLSRAATLRWASQPLGWKDCPPTTAFRSVTSSSSNAEGNQEEHGKRSPDNADSVTTRLFPEVLIPRLIPACLLCCPHSRRCSLRNIFPALLHLLVACSERSSVSRSGHGGT